MNFSIAIIIACIAILITLATISAVFGYDFVKCPNDFNIYPEGTECDIISQDYNDDDRNDSEVTEDEEEAMKEDD